MADVNTSEKHVQTPLGIPPAILFTVDTTSRHVSHNPDKTICTIFHVWEIFILFCKYYSFKNIIHWKENFW